MNARDEKIASLLTPDERASVLQHAVDGPLGEIIAAINGLTVSKVTAWSMDRCTGRHHIGVEEQPDDDAAHGIALKFSRVRGGLTNDEALELAYQLVVAVAEKSGVRAPSTTITRTTGTNLLSRRAEWAVDTLNEITAFRNLLNLPEST